MNQYIVGGLISLSATFVTEDGVPIDPEVVNAAVRLPDTTVEDVSASVIRVAAGVYKAQYTPTMNGLYTYRFSGLAGGEPISADESNFYAQTTFPE